MAADYVESQTPELTRELASYGFELGDYDESNPPESTMPVEELIIRILAKNPDPRYILGIPVIIAKNKVDYQRLIDLARQNSTLRRVGYLLDITNIVSEGRIPLNGIERHVQEAFNELNESMPEEELCPWQEDSKERFRDLANEKDKERIAAKWKVFTLNELEDIKDKFQLYCCEKRDKQEQRYAHMRAKYSKKGGAMVYDR